MDPNTSLALTEKGIDEVKRRTYKLSIRKRSVLLLLETPHRVDHLLQKTVLQPEEFGNEIEGLIHDGFVHVVGGAPPAAPATAPQAAPAAPPRPAQPQYSADPFAALAPPLPKAAPAAEAPVGNVHNEAFILLEDFILSEAKYLLVDFCVDSFGTPEFDSYARKCLFLLERTFKNATTTAPTAPAPLVFLSPRHEAPRSAPC